MKSKVIENNNLFLEISPEMGASIINFRDKRKNLDIFRPFPKGKKISKYNSYFTGYFPTIPYFGAIQKKSFLKQNKYISLPRTHKFESDTIHGEGWINKWKIINLNQNSLELFFKHNGKNSYPFAYKATQKFKLVKNSLIISITIENIDKYSFECGIGFHPWFYISKNSKLYSNSFNYLKEKKKNKFIKSTLIKNKCLDLNKIKIDETFLNWKGKSKLIINNNVSILIKNKKNIGNLHVYTPPNENFFCVEPVTNFRDAYYIKKLGYDYHCLKLYIQRKNIKQLLNLKF